MTDFPDLKLKVVPSFPGNIIGGVGIAATKEKGHVVIDMDWNEFGTQSSIPTSPTNNVLTFDPATNSYVMIPSHLLGGATAGISDAPNDGNLYGRQGAGWTKIYPTHLTAKQYGAVGNGIADDQPRLQALFNAGIAQGRPVFIEPGTYKLLNPLVVNGHLTVEGANNYSVLAPDPTTSGIVVVTNARVLLRDFAIQYPSGAPAAAGTRAISINGVDLGGPHDFNTHTVIERLFIGQAYDGIEIENAVYFTISDCYIGGWIHAAIVLDNSRAADGGDSTIARNTLAGNGAIGVWHRSFGGIRFVNNKIVGNFIAGSVGYLVQLRDGILSTDLQIFDNSIEGWSSHIVLARVGTTARLVNVQINNNEFQQGVGGAMIDCEDPSGMFVYGLQINSNMFYGGSSGTNYGIIANAARGIVIANNNMISNNGAGALQPLTVGGFSSDAVVSCNQRSVGLTGTGAFAANVIPAATSIGPN